MNSKISVGLLLLLATAMGYLMGTEAGREQRDALIRLIKRQNDLADVDLAAAGDAESGAGTDVDPAAD